MKKILLLTATIRPASSQIDLAVRSASDRLNEYIAALDFYWSRRGSFDLLIFAENSGYDLELLEARYPAESFCFLRTVGNVGDGQHRGFGELKIIREAMDFIRRREISDYQLLKVSGRYRLMNVTRVFDGLKACDCLTGELRPGWLELSAIAWNPDGGRRLIESWERCSPSLAPEIHLASDLASCSDFQVTPWRERPFLRGRLGATGREIAGRFWYLKYLAFVIGSMTRRSKRMY